MALPARGPAAVYALKAALVVGAYYGSAKVGLDLAFMTSSVTAVWPPTGIALAALVVWGPRMWPAVALGALLANAWTGVPLVTVLGITCGNTLEGVVGAYLLRRVAFRPSLERVRDVLALVVLAGGLSTTIAATIGVTSLIGGDELGWGDFALVWRTWWLGDMGGDLLVAPLLLVAATHWPFTKAPGRAPEAALLAAALGGVSLIVFSQETTFGYLIFPLLMWAALRFWQPGAAAANLVVVTIAVLFTAAEEGPFVRSNPDDSLLLAQTFFGVTGVTALVLAAVISERRRAEEIAEYIAGTLQEGLLPTRLPEIPTVELAARFRPAGDRYRVGGDFYDVFEAGDGDWAIALGDVRGKGPAAAAVTGLVRYTLRAAAIHERSPSRVLELLNDAVLRQRGAEEFCSVFYGRLEPTGGGARLTFSTGGHPLPLLLHRDGTVETAGAPGLLVGIEPQPGYVDHSLELASGDALLLYTDGLTEAYAPQATLAPADVAALARSCAGMRAEEIVERIDAHVLGRSSAEPRDDIALVALRVAPAADEEPLEISVTLGGAEHAPAAARNAIRSLHGRLPASVLGDVQLLTTELVTNSIRHGGAPVDLRLELTAVTVRVEVRDPGGGFEPPPTPSPAEERGFGWGLYLVEALADRWGVDSEGGGTRVWYEIERMQNVRPADGESFRT